MVDEVNGIVPKAQVSSRTKIDTPAQSVQVQAFNYQPRAQDKGTTVGSDVKNLNTYGKDITNFEKFRGNDKHDAMRMTNVAANDVKKAYMQLQHEFPNVAIQFEPMPDPKTCGKRREGFFTYQQQLEDWKDMALTQIANARETSTVDIAAAAVSVVNENSDTNAAMNADVTIAAAGAINANLDEKVESINENIDSEAAATRNTVIREARNTRDIVHVDGKYTRDVVRSNADEIKSTVEEEHNSTKKEIANKAKETQEIESLSNKISDSLTYSNRIHMGNTIRTVEGMRDRIISSNLSHKEKKELLNDLASWADQDILSDSELAKKQFEITKRIYNTN